MLSETNYKKYLMLLKVLAELFETNGIEYIMADGTLLGSFVMHDIIAWDDDVDFMVNYNDYPKLKRIYQDKIIFEDIRCTWLSRCCRRMVTGTTKNCV